MKELFPHINASIIQALHNLPQALEAVMPLQAKHRRTLPYAIEELSSRLTTERSLIKQAYWSAPRLTSAYLWYFLPWNILRLSRLLSNLQLPSPKAMPTRVGQEPKARLLVDLGSGPLSLPIALWLAKPQWHHIELNILCIDSAVQPLQLGQKLFTQIAGENSPWRIIPVRGKLETAHIEIQKFNAVPWLICAANVCNEIKLRQGQEDRSYTILESLSSLLKAQDSALLLVEPGTRLGGKTIVSMREAAIECGLNPISPCPHMQACPLEDGRTWCHFTFDTKGSPAWLNDLSIAAKLRKTALSLSFVLLNQSQPDATNNAKQARIISAPFAVPGVAGDARYACYEQGLGLVENAGPLYSGALIDLKDNTHERTDKKSGATILSHTENIAPAPKTNYTAAPTKPERDASKAKQEKDVRKVKQEKKKAKLSKKSVKKFWEK